MVNVIVNDASVFQQGAILPQPGPPPDKAACHSEGPSGLRHGSPADAARLIEALIQNGYIDGETIQMDGGASGPGVNMPAEIGGLIPASTS